MCRTKHKSNMFVWACAKKLGCWTLKNCSGIYAGIYNMVKSISIFMKKIKKIIDEKKYQHDVSEAKHQAYLRIWYSHVRFDMCVLWIDRWCSIIRRNLIIKELSICNKSNWNNVLPIDCQNATDFFPRHIHELLPELFANEKHLLVKKLFELYFRNT